MSVRTLHSPLVGRLIGLHLFWALAGLFTCVAVAFTLFWRDQLTELAAFVAVLPLVLALLGSRQLRRTLGVTAEIDAQLLQAASLSALGDLGLKPVHGANPSARGWNTIVDRVTGAAAFQRLETRLSEALS